MADLSRKSYKKITDKDLKYNRPVNKIATIAVPIEAEKIIVVYLCISFTFCSAFIYSFFILLYSEVTSVAASAASAAFAAFDEKSDQKYKDVVLQGIRYNDWQLVQKEKLMDRSL